MLLLWRFLKSYALPHWRWYVLGLAALYGTNQLTVLIPRFMKEALDALAAKDLPRSEQMIYALVASALGIIVIRTVSRISFFNPGRAVEFRLKNDLFQHLTRLPQSFHDQSRVGDLMSRATNDMMNVRALIGFAGLQLLEAAFIIPLTLQQMMVVAPELTLSTVGMLLLAVLVMYAATSAVVRLMRENLEQLARLSDHILDAYSAIPVLQGFCAQPAFLARFDACNEAYVRNNLSISRLRSFVIPLVVLLGSVATGLVLWKGGNAVLEGSLTIGALVAYSSLIGILVSRMMSFGWTLTVIQRGGVALARIYALLDTKAELPEVRWPLPPPRPARPQREDPKTSPSGYQLEVRGLTFTYAGAQERGPSLKDVSFSLEPGQTLGLFGRTGAGKSTLVHLLARVYTPPPGTIFLNGVDVRDLPLEALRERVALVPQDPFLFSTTLRENIRWSGVPPTDDAEDPRLEQAVRLACLEPDLQALSRGLETLVGARGITLSGGQRQRAALARAFYRRFQILLLDDVLAAVDHETERQLIRNIYGLTRHEESLAQTTVIISHRISALQHADQILVLEAGQVVAAGTHPELIARPGVYAETWETQRQAQEQAPRHGQQAPGHGQQAPGHEQAAAREGTHV